MQLYFTKNVYLASIAAIVKLLIHIILKIK